MLYPIVRMMWGINGNWDTPEITGGAYPIRQPMWIALNLSFGVKGKVEKFYSFDVPLNSSVRMFLEREFPFSSNVMFNLIQEFPLFGLPCQKYDYESEYVINSLVEKNYFYEFNMDSTVMKSFDVDFNVSMNPSNKILETAKKMKLLKMLKLKKMID